MTPESLQNMGLSICYLKDNIRALIDIDTHLLKESDPSKKQCLQQSTEAAKEVILRDAFQQLNDLEGLRLEACAALGGP